MAQRGVTFIVSIVLARLLLPEQFGLVAMLTIFIALAQTFIDSGLSSALIQKKDVEHVDECSVFYFNILLGIATYAILFAGAPWIAKFYGEPLLTSLARVIGLKFILSPFLMIQRTLLQKRLDFKSLALVMFIASLLSGILGISLAYHGFGVWALAYQQLASTVLLVVLFWYFSPWRPAFVFSLSSLRTLLSYGSRLLAAGVLNTIFRNVYLLVIGRFFSPGTLGFYSKAHQLQQMPTQTLTQVVRNVMFPVFSHLQDEPERFRRAISRTLGLLTMMIFPIMIGLATVAAPFVKLVLTEKWLPCVPYLQILCIVGMLFPLQVVNLNILKAVGRTDLFLRLSLIKKTLTVINIMIAIHWGVMGLVVGQVIGAVIAYTINARYSQTTAGYPLRKQIRDLAPYLGAALVMAAIVYSLKWTFIGTKDWTLLVGQVATGGAVYIALCWICRFPAFTEGFTIIQDVLQHHTGKYIPIPHVNKQTSSSSKQSHSKQPNHGQ